MDRTESRLRALFDFQRFAGNSRLEKLIRSVEETAGGVPLDDCELEVNAAGDADVYRLQAEDRKKL